MSVWFGQRLVNRLPAAIASSEEMGSLVRLLDKSLAESRLGKAAAAAKQHFVPKPLGARLGSGIIPGLLLGLMSYLICHVPHGRWGLFRIN